MLGCKAHGKFMHRFLDKIKQVKKRLMILIKKIDGSEWML
jgi:hypothetical protein